MSRYILIRRLRAPAFLLLVGALALLDQADILSWGKSWPLFLILAGVLLVAERAALAAESGYPPAHYPGVSDYRATANIPSYPGQPEPYIPPAHQPESGKEPDGGQS